MAACILRATLPGGPHRGPAENRGFTGGNAAGVEGASTGDVLLFLNNDMRVRADARLQAGRGMRRRHGLRRRPRHELGRTTHRLRARHRQLRGTGISGAVPAAQSPRACSPGRLVLSNGGAFAVTRPRTTTQAVSIRASSPTTTTSTWAGDCARRATGYGRCPTPWPARHGATGARQPGATSAG